MFPDLEAVVYHTLQSKLSLSSILSIIDLRSKSPTQKNCVIIGLKTDILHHVIRTSSGYEMAVSNISIINI